MMLIVIYLRLPTVPELGSYVTYPLFVDKDPQIAHVMESLQLQIDCFIVFGIPTYWEATLTFSIQRTF